LADQLQAVIAELRIAFTAEHLSLAWDLLVLAADTPDTVSRVVLPAESLPSNWRQVPAPTAIAAIGTAFAAERNL
jgi:hypothetical protein